MRFKPLIIAASVTGSVLGFGMTPAVAQHMNAKDAPCRDAGSGVDTTNCLFGEAKARDGELATQLGKVRPAIGGDELTLFNRAQANWSAYRKFQCEGERAM